MEPVDIHILDLQCRPTGRYLRPQKFDTPAEVLSHGGVPPDSKILASNREMLQNDVQLMYQTDKTPFMLQPSAMEVLAFQPDGERASCTVLYASWHLTPRQLARVLGVNIERISCKIELDLTLSMEAQGMRGCSLLPVPKKKWSSPGKAKRDRELRRPEPDELMPPLIPAPHKITYSMPGTMKNWKDTALAHHTSSKHIHDIYKACLLYNALRYQGNIMQFMLIPERQIGMGMKIGLMYPQNFIEHVLTTTSGTMWRCQMHSWMHFDCC